jgi:2'-hydroxyisoflavone reductase
MKVLVLGGTQFIGRHVVAKLIADGHEPTLLNRGRTAPGIFADLPLIRADREEPSFETRAELKQDWDAVIDLSAYFPRTLEPLLRALLGRTGRYVLCSTLSAYVASSTGGPTPTIEESSPLKTCTEEQARDTSMQSYGERKAECERVAMKLHAAGLPVTILRPSLVFGAHDHTDRMAYWLWRASPQRRPGTAFILPDDGLTIVRRTYAPDLDQAFPMAITKSEDIGQANNIAESDPLSIRDTVHAVGEHFGIRPLEDAVSLPADALLREGVKPWMDLPLWIPRTNLLVDTFKSRRDLDFVSTPAREALAAAADAFLREGREPKAGLSPSTEQELIAKLRTS